MRLFIRILTFILSFIYIFSFAVIYSSASELDSLLLLDELDINTDFSVNISNTYTDNKCIEEADANENGDFATLTCYVAYAQDENKENVFDKKFVDIFNSNGEFVCELTFITTLDPTLRMSGNYVYVIFYKTALVFDIVSREIKYYEIDADLLVREPEGSIKQDNEFEAGKWKYKLTKRQSLGYRQLIRSTDTETQVLVDIPRQFDYGYLQTPFCVGFAIFIIVWRRKKKRAKREEQGKRFKIDGFYTIDENGKIH